MVNPIGNQSFGGFPKPRKKKAVKGIDGRIKRTYAEKGESSLKASQRAGTKQAYLNAEKVSSLAKNKAAAAQRAAVKAQKAAFGAQRAHMAQQAAAVRKAREAEKKKKESKKAAKKASKLRRVLKIWA